MNEYTLAFSSGPESYVEDVFADLDPDAIELAEAPAAALCEGDWTKAVLLDNEVGPGPASIRPRPSGETARRKVWGAPSMRSGAGTLQVFD